MQLLIFVCYPLYIYDFFCAAKSSVLTGSSVHIRSSVHRMISFAKTQNAVSYNFES